MAAVSGNTVSDTKLMAATGKTRGEWHALLDAENAATWKHPEIAAWLHREHNVDRWWAQGITVGYEQARGLRVPGQQPDGSFAAGSSKTVSGGLLPTLDKVIVAVSDHFGVKPVTVGREARHPTARWELRDGTGLLATISPPPIGTVDKCRIALTRLQLEGPDDLGPAKDELAGVLKRFSE